MRKPDEIMAEYLLKGGKMLAKTCPACHSPLFEHKGETFCVVCREEQEEGKNPDKASSAKVATGQSVPLTVGTSAAGRDALLEAYTTTILILLERIRTEGDSNTITTLMQAATDATGAYALLAYGYGCRESS